MTSHKTQTVYLSIEEAQSDCDENRGFAQYGTVSQVDGGFVYDYHYSTRERVLFGYSDKGRMIVSGCNYNFSDSEWMAER
jgi:hypothetical protein